MADMRLELIRDRHEAADAGYSTRGGICVDSEMHDVLDELARLENQTFYLSSKQETKLDKPR